MRLTVVVLLIAAAAGRAPAACGNDPADAAAVAAARAEIAARCDCRGAGTHGAYMRCAVGEAARMARTGGLRPACKRAVKRCAARSVCGRSGETVTCCLDGPRGSRCRTARSAAACTRKGGRVSACASCCEACSTTCLETPNPTTTTTSPTGTTQSSTTSTTTSSTTSTTSIDSLPRCGEVLGPPFCSGQCPPNLPVCRDLDGSCRCTPGPALCGPLGAPQCDGACPPGQACVGGGVNTCGCIPADSEPCVLSEYPSCGGACPGGSDCVSFTDPAFTGCLCPPVTCGDYPTCGGTCPAGGVCTRFPIERVHLCICQ